MPQTSMLKSAISSMVTKVAAIPYAWSEPKANNTVLFQNVAVWNNQIGRQEKGQIIPSDYPQAYIQPILGRCIKLGLGVTQFPDAIFRLHMADWLLDSGDGTLDQNLEVFEWRDRAKSQLQTFFPSYCSALTQAGEEEDFDHEGVYHYTVDFKTCFTDSKGGQEDPDQTSIISIFPITVVETIEFNDEPLPPVTTLYGWKVCMIMVYVVDTPDGTTQILDNGDIIPLQYALNDDGTLTIPELVSYPGIAVLTPFIMDNNSYDNMPYNATTNKFDNSLNGGFAVGAEISFNASLPIITEG